MFRRFIMPTILLLVLVLPVSAQPWLRQDSLQRQPTTFYDVQRMFYDYWKTHDPTVKGSGWKQFKRWEWFWEQRLYPTGMLPSPTILYDEWKKEQDELLRKQMEEQSKNGGKRGKEKVMAGNWTLLGPDAIPPSLSAPPWKNSGVGRINCLRIVSTTATVMWIGTAGGGIWKSGNSGLTWTDKSGNMPILGISDIAITTTGTVYIATGDADGSQASSSPIVYSLGVMKSTNDGTTWSTTQLLWAAENSQAIYRLLLHPHPDSSAVLLAATTDGVYRTADGGTSWQKVLSYPERRYTDMEFHPSNPSIVYVGGYNSSTATAVISRSTNAGITWTDVTTATSALRVALAVSTAATNTVYGLFVNPDGGFRSIHRSTDAGITWSTRSTYNVAACPNILGTQATVSTTAGQGTYDLALVVSPTNANHVYVGGINVWLSTDGATTWQIKAHWSGAGGVAYMHADHHDLQFQPGSGTTLYSANDGGLWKSTDAGTAWSSDNLNNGLSIMQFYRLGCSATSANLIVGGAQDNGTNFKTGAAINTWRHCLDGDGMECILPSDPGYLYACFQEGGLRRSSDLGVTYTNIKPVTTAGAWVTPYVIHPTNSQTLFAGYDQVYRTTNRGMTWSTISTLAVGEFRSLAISASDPATLYAANILQIFRCTNATAAPATVSWTSIAPNPGFPLFIVISSIAVHPSDPKKLWAAFSGYRAERVAFSSDGGNNWQDYSEGLPILPVNTIVCQKNSPDLVYVGTDLGVYYRHKGMKRWEPYKDGLPNVIVTELEIQESASKLRAATYGRGIWESPIIAVPKIMVLEPNGGETLITGSTATIRWYADATIASVNIEYSISSGATWNTIATTVAATTGSISWFVPNTPTTQALVRITNTTVATMKDVSDSLFTIAPAVRLVAPNGGTTQSFAITSTTAIVWSVHTMATVTTLTIQYRLSSTAAWSTITTNALSVGTTGSYTWSVPAPTTTQASVRILFVTTGTTTTGSITTATIEDTSDSVFAITTPIRVIAPNGKEQIPIASPASINWAIHPQATVTSLTVQYRLTPTTAWITVTNATVGGTTGSCVWLTPAQLTTQASVRIFFVTTATTVTGGVTTATVEDTSDSTFSLVKPIKLIAPRGGICLPTASTATIQWNIHTQATVTSLTLQYRLSTSAAWTTIATVVVTGTTGSYTWTTPTQATTQASVRILYTTTASTTTGGITTVTIEDENETPFSIGSPIALFFPNGGEVFYGGTQATILWQPDSSITYVMLEYSLNNGQWWIPIGMMSNTGSYLWTVPDTASSTALVRIYAVMSTTAGICTDDISDSTFSILQIVAPPSGLTAYWSGSAVQLSWMASPSPGVIAYNIYRRLSSSATFSVIATVASPMTFYADSTAALGLSYDYAVTALKTTIESGFSNIVTITPSITPPSGLTAYWSGSAVQLYWTASPSPGVIAYNIYRRLSSSATFSVIATVAAPMTFYADSTAALGLSYDYAVTAVTASIESGFSNIVTIAPPSVLPPPTLIATWSGGAVQLYWMASPSPGVIAYNIYRRQYPSPTFIPIATVAAPLTFYTDSTALVGVTYEYAVTALTASLESGFSPIVIITPLPTLTLSSPNGGEVLTSGSVFAITWTPVADTLQLEYSCNNGMSWNLIGVASGMSGSLSWSVPNMPTARARVRISSLSGPAYDVSDNNFTIRSGVQTALNIRLLLEGAYDPSMTMTSALQFLGQLPLVQPYNTSPFFYGGGETRGSCILDSIVDWVLVELRSSANPTIVIARTAALLRTDGMLIDETGYPEVLLSAPPGMYYVALQHRNHLEVMTAVPVPLFIGSSPLYTFTISQSQAYIISMPSMHQLGTGIYGLSAGDVNGDGIINATDRVAIINAYGAFGYRVEDVSLDGIVNAIDYVLTNNNQFITSQVP